MGSCPGMDRGHGHRRLATAIVPGARRKLDYTFKQHAVKNGHTFLDARRSEFAPSSPQESDEADGEADPCESGSSSSGGIARRVSTRIRQRQGR